MRTNVKPFEQPAPLRLDDAWGEHFIAFFDPGGTTGWSVWDVGDAAAINTHPGRGGQIFGGAEGFAIARGAQGLAGLHISHMVVEGFEQDATTAYADIMDAIEIIGMLRYIAKNILGCSFEIQRRSQKALVTDDDLRRLGFWVPGQRHRNDTALHALAWAKSQDHQPTLAAYWPPELWESSSSEVIDPERLVAVEVSEQEPAVPTPRQERGQLEAFADQGCPWGECEHDESDECPLAMVDACIECSDAEPIDDDGLTTIIPWAKAEERRHRPAEPHAWRDRQGDVWTLGDDGLLHAYETRPFTREYVEGKWGPLTPLVAESGGIGEGSDA